MKKIWLLLLFFLILPCSTQAFVLGLKSTDNTVQNIVDIEKTYQLYLPIVAFIYDPWEQQDVVAELEKMKAELGDQRIYHISVSPNQFSAEEVANGAFDEQYKLFFQTIKKLKLKVVFRTMHEMNGGRYPRGSNPEMFKKAWIHVWELSRSLGLDQQDILFDFSVNHWDMPTLWKPSQQAKLIQCKALEPVKNEVEKLKKKKKLTAEEQSLLKNKEKELKKLKSCPHFEDYFPGEAYVDIVGITFYNRGKATSNRLWRSPAAILNDPERKTLERAQKLGKPLFIDEVGTTAVRYGESYSPSNSRNEFLSSWSDIRKNQWLRELSELSKANHFVGAVYFNVDYTNGLNHALLWEADWAIINTTIGKFYEGFRDLYSSSKSDFSSLLALFGLTKTEINGKEKLVPQIASKDIKLVESMVNGKITDPKERSDFYSQLLSSPSGKRSFDTAIEILAEEYRGSGATGSASYQSFSWPGQRI